MSLGAAFKRLSGSNSGTRQAAPRPDTTAGAFEAWLLARLTLLAFIYFGLRLIFYAVSIAHDIPPDEITHLGKCLAYARAWLLPADSAATFSLGLITHRPYLFFFLMGKSLWLNIFPVSDLVFLRLLNAGLTLATVYVAWKWIALLTDNPRTRFLFLILTTNTAMFTFVGASVSYDNLTNLMSVAALYYMHRHFRAPSIRTLLLFGIALLAGALTKRSFLPLPPLFLLVFVFHERKRLGTWLALLKDALHPIRPGNAALAGLALLLLALNLELYAGNLIRFGHLLPRTLQVLTVEQAMQYRLFARDHIQRLYRSGKISYEQAEELASHISHEGDRATALEMLDQAQENKERPVKMLSRWAYTLPWLKIMLYRSVNVFGHQVLSKRDPIMAVYQAMFLSALACLVFTFRPSEARGGWADALFLVVAYGLFLMQWVNYPIYRGTLVIDVALQGRYMFPVLVPLYGLAAYYLLKPWPRWVQITFLSILTCFYVLYDFPDFLLKVRPDWFRPLF